MTFDAFQKSALRTWNQDEHESLVNAALGLAGECGEVVEMVKKSRFHAKSIGITQYRDELGDVLYYVAVCAHECGLSLDEIAHANVEKLRARYPDGFVPGGGIR